MSYLIIFECPRQHWLLLNPNKRSSKIVRNDFRFLPSSYFHRTGPNESIGTKIFKKFDRKLGQNQSRSSLVQKSAILTGLKSETEIFDRLEWSFMTLTIVCWVDFVVSSTIAEENLKNIKKSGTILIFWSQTIYFF